MAHIKARYVQMHPRHSILISPKAYIMTFAFIIGSKKTAIAHIIILAAVS